MKLWSATAYLLARFEVSYALLTHRINCDNHCEDLLPLRLIPSMELQGSSDRILAEIDQDGFIFAVAGSDAQFFNTRETMVPRRHHRVQIVLTSGLVRLRKSIICRRSGGLVARLRECIQWEFYLETAALLRLRGLPCVPTIRHIDPGLGIVEMDYIWGKDLRQVFSDGASEIDYDKVSRIFSTIVKDPDTSISIDITDVIAHIISRGVIPRDLHAGNFIRAWHSGKLYMVDFALIYLRPVPGWRSHVKNLARVLGNRVGGSESQRHPRGSHR